MGPTRESLLAALAVTVAGCVWGALWIPLRHLESTGLVGPWATIGGEVAATLVMLPLALRRWRRWKAIGPLFLMGLFGGAAFVLYNNGPASLGVRSRLDHGHACPRSCCFLNRA